MVVVFTIFKNTLLHLKKCQSILFGLNGSLMQPGSLVLCFWQSYTMLGRTFILLTVVF